MKAKDAQRPEYSIISIGWLKLADKKSPVSVFTETWNSFFFLSVAIISVRRKNLFNEFSLSRSVLVDPSP